MIVMPFRTVENPVVGRLVRARATIGLIIKSDLKAGPGVGPGHPRFAVKFFVTAMLFILFDVEMVYLLPWALVYRDFLAQSIPIFLPGLVFLTILVTGLYYENKKGALEWEK